MDTLEIDDQLTIVNRSIEYRVSKKLIRKIPYFEKMLSHGLKESKENKVELDFDERAFKTLLDAIQFRKISIEMDYAIALYNMCDYFGLTCSRIANFVTDKLTIEHLPVVIPQATSTSVFINSGALNAFICRYFPKIANTTVWINYPIETIEYICKLNLMIHSEMQVFEAIMKWVSFKCDSRKFYLERLLKLVRWHYLDDKDLPKIRENELFKSLEFNPKFCLGDKCNCDCNISRTEQEYFVLIEECGHEFADIRIILLANNFKPLFNRVFKLDKSLSEHIISDEHISDIMINHEESFSGKRIIRIDWKHNKYRWLDFEAFSDGIFKCISIDCTKGKCASVEVPSNINYNFPSTFALLEAKEQFILIDFSQSFNYWTKPSYENFINCKLDYLFSPYCHVNHKETILDNKIYILTTDLEFIELDIDRNCALKIIGLQIFNEGLRFSNLHLTSKQAHDNRIIFFDRYGKNVYCFNVNTRQWSSIGQIIYCDFSEDRKNSKRLISFTSAFLSVSIIDFA